MIRRSSTRAALAAGLSTVVVLTGVATAQAAAPQSPPARQDAPGVDMTPASVTDRLIVRYRTATPGGSAGVAAESKRRDTVVAEAAKHGVAAEYSRAMTGGAQVWQLDRTLSDSDVAAIAAAVEAADPSVEYAEPDRIMVPMAEAPNDPLWSSQWDLATSAVGIDVRGAWDTTQGAGVTVAVIDTGYRPHADLAANIVGGYDMIADTSISNDGNGRDSDASDPGDWTVANQCGTGWPGYDSSWHGTHVAGTIAAVTGNGAGVAGIAPAAKVLPVRVLGQCGGYTSDIADAMVWASGGSVSGVPANANPARVLNLSLGGSGSCDSTSQNAINTARANGAVVVVAAGNSATDVSSSSPANCSGVVAVAAYGPTGARAYYSNYGSLVDLAAPGGDMSSATSNGIISTLNSGATTPGADSYEYYQGTSMATPHVAGVAALMIAANPSLTPDQVESLLKSSAQPFVASCSGCGAGMLDAATAVAAATGTVPDPGTDPDPAVSETEPNDSRSTADVVSAPGDLTGTMGSSSDTDYYSVSLAARTSLSVTLTPPSSSDYDLYLYNSSGRVVARSINGTGQVDSISYTTGSKTATYYVRVVYYSGATGSSGTYGLSLSW
ncbi:S8 family serine peptidase [Actinotalea sp. M2MS4P-6]|uniref:S8 family peptidase n=1 Tax=Actinotalea sp. M2MS4P-6 TaxID=2983762 RepID=UPI0021E4BE94|nr:S8 family peptidase [Actinotalea sp. M2MS4P-6]MCV2395100.1 S8 family serine peptidase [Actinotalea sp. M2MS4P-6]